MKHFLAAGFLLILALTGAAHADVSDDFATLQTLVEETLLDSLGAHSKTSAADDLRSASEAFASHLTTPAAKTLWAAPNDAGATNAQFCGAMQARLQHVIALEMLAAQRAGNIAAAKEWRALITLPKRASAVEGALALERIGTNRAQADALSALLAKEFITWQSTRIREKLDNLKRTVAAGRATAELVAARLAEARGLAQMPLEILRVAKTGEAATLPASAPLDALAQRGNWKIFLEEFSAWKNALEAGLPNLLTPQEVARQERLLLKLVALVPKEYKAAGVHDGNITVPLEYHHAQSFLVQSEQLINELSACWRTQRPEAYTQHLEKLREQLDNAETLLARKVSSEVFDDAVSAATKTLEKDFGLSLAQNGANGVDELALEIHTALSASLAAAQAGKWQEAEAARLDAYTSFDLTIEKKVMPRDPKLAVRAERSFLDGSDMSLGIKTALDRKLRGAELERAYQRTLADLAECQALLKVAISPATISFTTATVVMREGLEAVVILAAILAGLRGRSEQRQRKGLIRGAWVAIAVTVLTFWLSRTLIKSLNHYGEKLEAVVSILAVFILLLVTNWVFHKVYWVQWNTKLRHLRKKVEGAGAHGSRWESLGLVGVGFLTIYREGFETTLFLQSLILEGGIKAVSIGLCIGLLFIATVGFAVFKIGARLPYRRMLVITGLLVVSILVTFLGSTVRLFQTVGWMPIHPIVWLHIPAWMGLWFGLYPSWEGMLIPPAGLVYVGGAWLYTKIRARINAATQISQIPPRPAPAAGAPRPDEARPARIPAVSLGRS